MIGYSSTIFVPSKTVQVHPQLIGYRGNAIQKVMQEFHVRIDFPNRRARETVDANSVLVTGDAKDVDLACDFLIARANDLVSKRTCTTVYSCSVVGNCIRLFIWYFRP